MEHVSERPNFVSKSKSARRFRCGTVNEVVIYSGERPALIDNHIRICCTPCGCVKWYSESQQGTPQWVRTLNCGKPVGSCEWVDLLGEQVAQKIIDDDAFVPTVRKETAATGATGTATIEEGVAGGC